MKLEFMKIWWQEIWQKLTLQMTWHHTEVQTGISKSNLENQQTWKVYIFLCRKSIFFIFSIVLGGIQYCICIFCIGIHIYICICICKIYFGNVARASFVLFCLIIGSALCVVFVLFTIGSAPTQNEIGFLLSWWW